MYWDGKRWDVGYAELQFGLCNGLYKVFQAQGTLDIFLVSP